MLRLGLLEGRDTVGDGFDTGECNRAGAEGSPSPTQNQPRFVSGENATDRSDPTPHPIRAVLLGHQWLVPGAPLKGPVTLAVTQPP